MSIDFRTCPNCKEPLFVRSLERLEGTIDVDIFTDDQGNVTEASWGDSRTYWDSSVTQTYVCDECQEELPENYQIALDQLLDSNRMEAA